MNVHAASAEKAFPPKLTPELAVKRWLPCVNGWPHVSLNRLACRSFIASSAPLAHAELSTPSQLKRYDGVRTGFAGSYSISAGIRTTLEELKTGKQLA